MSFREARQIALSIFIEAERALQEERIADARFIDALWEREPSMTIEDTLKAYARARPIE